MTTNFFDEQKEQSKVKTLIVTKYFEAWARVIMGVQDANNRGRNGGNEIQYLDLFAGPGYYTDGTKSTPIIILEKAIQNNRLRERLVHCGVNSRVVRRQAVFPCRSRQKAWPSFC